MKKKIFAFGIILLLMLITLTGCEKDTEDSKENVSKNNSVEETLDGIAKCINDGDYKEIVDYIDVCGISAYSLYTNLKSNSDYGFDDVYEFTTYLSKNTVDKTMEKYEDLIDELDGSEDNVEYLKESFEEFDDKLEELIESELGENSIKLKIDNLSKKEKISENLYKYEAELSLEAKVDGEKSTEEATFELYFTKNNGKYFLVYIEETNSDDDHVMPKSNNAVDEAYKENAKQCLELAISSCRYDYMDDLAEGNAIKLSDYFTIEKISKELDQLGFMICDSSGKAYSGNKNEYIVKKEKILITLIENQDTIYEATLSETPTGVEIDSFVEY